MTHPITLHHSDTVSGITILECGTVCVWTEGRSGEIDVIRRPGSSIVAYPRLESVPVYKHHEINTLLDEVWAEGRGETREMTKAEEAMYDALRGITAYAVRE